MDLIDISDRIQVMRRKEQTTYSCSDYLSMTNDTDNIHNSPSSSLTSPDSLSGIIDKSCREKMSRWCFQVVDFASFRRETVSVSMSFLDRYLSLHQSNLDSRKAMDSRKTYQLASMTALFIAAKLFEPTTMDVDIFVQLGRGCYGKQEFIDMEKRILAALNWQVSGPTTTTFIELYLSMLIASTSDADKSSLSEIISTLWLRSKYQSELACLESSFVTEYPSHIALATIINSLQYVPLETFTAEQRFDFMSLIQSTCNIDYHSSIVQSIGRKLKYLESQHQSRSFIEEVEALKPSEDFLLVKSTASSTSRSSLSGSQSPTCVSHKEKRTC